MCASKARWLSALAGMSLILWNGSVSACPFCCGYVPTIADKLLNVDGAFAVIRVGPPTTNAREPVKNTYEIVNVFKDSATRLRRGDRVNVRGLKGEKGSDLFLLTGSRPSPSDPIQWESPTPLTRVALDYIAKIPAPGTSPRIRLAYFIEFLEFPDEMIANDAFVEFSNAAYDDIAAVAPRLNREKVRIWMSGPQTAQTRFGLYGMLLGLCGKPEDAEFLAQKIAPNTGEQFRLGIDGMIGGYLLLSHTVGLENIEHWKLQSKDASNSEIFAAMSALRFMWDYGAATIPRERLEQSMRLLLDRPEFADMAITDLARWEDWSVQDRLFASFGRGKYSQPQIKRAIVRYLAASARAKPFNQDAHVRNRAERGKRYLDELRRGEPGFVRAAEQSLF